MSEAEAETAHPAGERGSMRRVTLGGPADFAGFRNAARRLLEAGAPPERVEWSTGDRADDLFQTGESRREALENGPHCGPPRPAPRVNRAFLDLAQSASLHREEGRFALLYRILWRLGDEPRLLALAADADIMRLGDLAKAVRRDIHKMHAFVRFREVASPEGEAFVAWYEPDHHTVEAAAPFFARRFASLRWTILTPRRSVCWTGDKLVFGPGAEQREAPSDDRLEDLWRTYYANIFNPARVNPEAMRAEMPKRFWRNLPEAGLIGGLVAQAPARAAAMIAAAPTLPVQRRGAAYAPAVPDAGEGLAGLPARLEGCRACPLWEPATQPIPGEGPAAARLMIVGEQPGDEEDISGRPFVGPAGRVLDRALAQAGVPRDGVYLTNAVKHFKFEPRGKKRIHKRPAAGEIHACLPWLQQEIAGVDPAVIVMLGASAAQAVLGRSVAVTRERGAPFRLQDGRWALVTTHPSYVLRLQDRREAEAAFAAMTGDLAAAAALARDAGDALSAGRETPTPA